MTMNDNSKTYTVSCFDAEGSLQHEEEFSGEAMNTVTMEYPDDQAMRYARTMEAQGFEVEVSAQ